MPNALYITKTPMMYEEVCYGDTCKATPTYVVNGTPKNPLNRNFNFLCSTCLDIVVKTQKLFEIED
jgi:hypothetical protein